MVEWAVVDWGDRVALFHDIDGLDGDGCEFYAVVSAAPIPDRVGEWQKPYELLYIGLAYHQTVHERIRQDHQSYGQLTGYLSEHRRERDVLVMLGRLHAYSPARVTQEFVKDVEALLIRENRPTFNKRNKNQYNGRPLVVVRHPATDDETVREPIMRYSMSSQKAFTMWLDGEGWEDMRKQLAEG